MFSAQRSFSSICCRTVLVVLNYLNFCLSGKLLISPSDLNKSLARQSIFGCRFFPFISLNISYHSLLACRVSVEKSVDNLMRIPLYVICSFPLVAFNILSFNFCQFDYHVSRCVPPWVYLAWDSDSWTWLTISFSMLGKFLAMISSNTFTFSGPFSLSSPSGTLVM